MITKKLKKQIEWHFYNHRADLALYKERRDDILEAGLTACLCSVGGRSSTPSNPTESKAFKLLEIGDPTLWGVVINNVVIAFEFEVQGEIIQDKFDPQGLGTKKLKYHQLVSKYGGYNANRSVYDYRYNKIMELAAEWAAKFGLIRLHSPYG